MNVKKFFVAIACLAAAVSCSRHELPYDGEYEGVFIYCGLGYNNLSGDIEDNFEDMKNGILPERRRDKAVVAICHNTARAYDYTTPNPPVLLQLYRSKGKTVTDTLKIYPEESVSASASFLREALLDIKELFPSKSYGMLLSSHATGWLPDAKEVSGIRLAGERENPDYPLTKTIGAQYSGSYADNSQIELKEFAGAIPMQLDYLIFDACLMGGIEVAWELKDKCRRLVISPTEVLASGMSYKNMSWHLLSGAAADLESVCREYFGLYDAQSGLYRSATISLVDCSMLEPLGKAFSDIVVAHGGNIGSIAKDEVQKYFYQNSGMDYFYDLRDLARCMGADEEELAALDEALQACVPYHAATPAFFNLKLERCHGLSVYLPSEYREELNAYYRTLSWNKATSLVK